MEATDLSSNSVDGRVRNWDDPQFNQSVVSGSVDFRGAANQSLPDRVSTIPRTVNHHLYTGRKEIADRLATAFQADTQQEQQSVRVFVITGLGGIGKSEICLKYAEDNIERYWGRFWIDLNDSDHASESYTNLSQQCGWGKLAIGAIRWKLSSCARRWLLILDNVDEPNMDLQDYLPAGGAGDVIVTSRNPKCSEHATVGTEILHGLNDKLSEELLLKIAGIHTVLHEAEMEVAKEVVKILDHHTLALVQAGSYVGSGLCTFAEYPVLYRQQKEELMSRTEQQQESKYSSMYATFEVSAKWLERESVSGSNESQSAGDSLNLLHILSFMSRNGKMQRIFTEANRHANSILGCANRAEDTENTSKGLDSYHANQLPDFAPQKWKDAAGHTRWREACNLLERLSLVTIRGADQDEHLSLHPLVHAWAKDRQDPALQNKTWIITACVLGLACGDSPQHPLVYQALPRHVRSCIRDVLKHILKLKKTRAWRIAFQLKQILRVSSDSEDWKVSKPLLDVLYSIARDKKEGEDEEAMQYLELVVRLLAGQNEADPDLLAAQCNLALAYARTERFGEAIQLLERVIPIASRLDGQDQNLLSLQETVVFVNQDEKLTAESMQLLESIVQAQKSRLDEGDLELLASQQRLADVYLSSGQIREGVKLQEHVVHVANSMLDEANEFRLTSQHKLASMYVTIRRTREAIKLLEYVVRLRNSTLEEWDLDRLGSQQRLAAAYLDDEQLQKAVTVLSQTVIACELRYGEGFELSWLYRKSLETAQLRLDGILTCKCHVHL